ncbi:TetR/AcrR family transcriptional regulator [Bacillus sp. T3]|uniref:TetR/AcrR family transcriptional regulator n=1 Tax=Bacillus sp. T3 TaxID=467262 RepID=UPI0029816B2D|nr:TetR/AcrR family transcriptional regulator [Bacillus sp. T3]
MMILLHRKDGIITSTIEALHDVGIQNLSTKEIAKREGVSEGTLFRHYKNKTEILLAVLEHYSQYDDDIIQTCINRELAPIETLRNYILSYAEYYTNYPEITTIVHAYDSLMRDPLLENKVRSIIIKRTNFIQITIEKAIEIGELRGHIHSGYLTDLIVGGFRATCLRWRMEKQSFSLKDRTIWMIDMLIDGFVKE